MNTLTELYEKMSHLQWLLHRQHLKAHSAAGPGANASRGQGRILAFLKMKDGIGTRDLSYLLRIRVSSLNELLAKLEKAGYITREPSETDKRVMLIYLTEKGRQEEEEAPAGGNIFSCLSPDEQSTFGEYLDRIIAALETELGTEVEWDEMLDRMETAGGRMGAEQFEKFKAMCGMWGGRHGFGRGDHGRGDHGRGDHGRESCGFGPDRNGHGRKPCGFGPDRNGHGRESCGFGQDRNGHGRKSREFGPDRNGHGRKPCGFGQDRNGHGRESCGFGQDRCKSASDDIPAGEKLNSGVMNKQNIENEKKTGR